jgi:hypothetical protein
VFPPIYLTNPENEYTDAIKCYYTSSPKYSPSKLLPAYQADIGKLLEDPHKWSYIESHADEALGFTKYVHVPLDQSAFIRVLKDSFSEVDFKLDDGNWRAYFRENFAGEYLGTQKQRSGVKWLFKQ